MHLNNFGKLAFENCIHALCYCSRLQECHEKLQFDISDKIQALTIDTDCVGLGNSSSGINMQTDPTRIKKG